MDPVRPVRVDGRSSSASASSARAAANLSLDRLYRKRAIDRENQRVLRQKNKARLAELEAEVRSLTARLEHAEAGQAHAVRVQASTASLGAIVASLQSLQMELGALSQTATSASSASVSAASESDSLSSPLTPVSSPASTTGKGHAYAVADQVPDLWTLPGASVTVVGTRNSEFAIDIDALAPHPADEPSPPPQATAYQAARVQANRLRHAVGSSPVWAVTPSYVPPTCRMDELLSLRGSTANAGLAATASRLPPIQAVDTAGLPPLSSVQSLLNPVRGPLSDTPSETAPSAIAHQVASTLTAFATPERTALLYTMCIYLQWLVMPSQGYYDAIPDFLRPTAAQLVVPHAFWVDTIPWPLARDRIISHLDYTHAHTFSALFVRTFSINWPHALDGMLQRASDHSLHLVVSPAFVQHVRDPANWSVGPELVDAFPFLDGAVSVR